MLNLLLFCVKWNLIIVATGDVAPGEKNPTNKKTENKSKNKHCLQSFMWLAALSAALCFLCMFFFFTLNKSLFIPAVDFLSSTTILCYYFFMRPPDLFFHGREADECQPFRSLPATISHQIYVLKGAVWSPVPI